MPETLRAPDRSGLKQRLFPRGLRDASAKYDGWELPIAPVVGAGSHESMRGPQLRGSSLMLAAAGLGIGLAMALAVNADIALESRWISEAPPAPVRVAETPPFSAQGAWRDIAAFSLPQANVDLASFATPQVDAAQPLDEAPIALPIETDAPDAAAAPSGKAIADLPQPDQPADAVLAPTVIAKAVTDGVRPTVEKPTETATAGGAARSTEQLALPIVETPLASDALSQATPALSSNRPVQVAGRQIASGVERDTDPASASAKSVAIMGWVAQSAPAGPEPAHMPLVAVEATAPASAEPAAISQPVAVVEAPPPPLLPALEMLIEPAAQPAPPTVSAPSDARGSGRMGVVAARPADPAAFDEWGQLGVADTPNAFWPPSHAVVRLHDLTAASLPPVVGGQGGIAAAADDKPVVTVLSTTPVVTSSDVTLARPEFPPLPLRKPAWLVAHVTVTGSLPTPSFLAGPRPADVQKRTPQATGTVDVAADRAPPEDSRASTEQARRGIFRNLDLNSP